jgi:hypothetical protein
MRFSDFQEGGKAAILLELRLPTGGVSGFLPFFVPFFHWRRNCGRIVQRLLGRIQHA